ncbi:MAG TPA: sialidase family protein [Chitinophagaceae bacterium]|nr:sialidase family protein [Chitinophagaceae bacterium]
MKYLLNKMVRRVIPTVIFLLLSAGSALLAQNGNVVDKFAVVVSEKNDTGKKASAGTKIFYDQDFVFDQLPSILSEMDFLTTSMLSGNRVIPVTEGYVYIVTPLDGEAGSQEKQLVAMGFVKTSHVGFKLFKEQQQEAGIFEKYISFQKFRLGHISFEGWAVPFFKNRELASVAVPAKWTWMPGSEFAKDTRKWQGCPSIEITGKRIWGAWFSGGKREPDAGNYGIVSYSDDGKTWIDPAMIISHPDTNVRVMDTQLWKDPDGRLWVFWTQNTGQKGFDGKWGTWAINTPDPGSKNPSWSKPKRLADGLTRNKPIVLSTGEWLLPSYNWINHQSAVYISKDKGEQWTLRGGPLNEPVDNFYEHMMVERKTGDIWMLQRSIRESISKDKGISWSSLDSVPGFTSANSRLYIGRLQSGRLLLIYNNDRENKRKNLTAFLSDDEGVTWPHKLILDERDNVSYPDAVQDADGKIYVCYDRSRTGEKEILMTVFTEGDIVKGKFISSSSEKKKVISKPAQ